MKIGDLLFLEVSFIIMSADLIFLEVSFMKSDD